MLLSDIELQAEIDANRLVFSPTLERGAIQSTSIDLALSRRFWRPNLPGGTGIETIVNIDEATAYQYFEGSRMTRSSWNQTTSSLGKPGRP